MKKSLVQLSLFFIIFSFLFFGCSNKLHQKSDDLIKENIRDFYYYHIVNQLTEDNNTSFLPESIKTKLNRYYIQDGIFYTFFELLYPGRINQYNTLNFYDLYNDDCKWIDSMLISLEEEKIAEQISELENHLSDVVDNFENDENVQNAEKAEKEIKELIKNEVMTDDHILGYMEYGNEKFIPQKIGDNYILVHADGDLVSRDFYDKLFRCVKTEQWKISESNEDLFLSSEKNFIEDSYIPSQITTKSDEEIQYQTFNSKGLLVEERIFVLCEDKEYIKSSLKLKYNNNDKISESINTDYKYKDEKYSKLDYSFTKKYVYKYNNDDIPADFDYYENDILKMKKKYSTKDNYKTWIYFDNDYSVMTIYQDNKPVKEVFSVKDRVERVNNYAQ